MALRFCSLGSGSAGNATLVEARSEGHVSRLLIDCGFGIRQLEARLARERDFAEYASHELRTPLTALRMELEDLALRDDMPDDVKASAGRCVRRVDDVDSAAGHLVSITRQGALVEGGQDRMGQTVHIPMPDRTIAATITGTVFVDPENTRLKI